MKKYLSLIALLSMVSCGFGGELSGVVDTRTVEVPGNYHEIVVKGGVNVLLDAQATAITLTGDTTLVKAITVSQKGGELTIDASRKLLRRKGLRLSFKDEESKAPLSEVIDIVIPAPVILTAINLAGAVNFTSVEPVKTGKLEIESAGANHVAFACDLRELSVEAAGADTYLLEGPVMELDLEMAGACSFGNRERYLTVNKASIDLAGACAATLCSVGTVKGSAVGACNVAITGAGETRIKTRGASSLTRF